MAVDRILKIFGGMTVLAIILFIWKCLKDEKMGKGRLIENVATKVL